MKTFLPMYQVWMRPRRDRVWRNVPLAAVTLRDLRYKPAVVDLLDRNVVIYPTATFYNIGASHGCYPALVSTRYPNWRVEAFEPNPVAFNMLEVNFDHFKIRGNAHCIALNDLGEALYFKGRSVVPRGSEGAILVQGTQFDTFVPTSSDGSVIVKIDVRGAEGMVLAGMSKAMRDSIDALLIEVHAHHLLVGDYVYREILLRFEQAGFSVFEVVNFRYSSIANLLPLVGDAREQFVNYS